MTEIDHSPWDGNRAMTECKTAEDYNKICAGKKAGDPALRESHALPHHYLAKHPAPNADGVRAALQRLDQTEGLTNRAEAKAHLDAHMQDIHDAGGMMGSSRRLEHVASLISETAWAIHPASLSLIVQIVGERRSGHRPTAEEIRRRIGVRENRDDAPKSGIAVIPIDGPIVPKGGMFTDVSSPEMTSVQGLQSAFRAAVADDEIAAIVLDIDSPGGSVDLIPELASEITAARGSKPIVAVANTFAASAAYWLATAADELVVSPSGQVGSIGVYTVHQDLSAAMEQKGIKNTFISAGEYKTEGNAFEPLSDDARAEIQRVVDSYYGMFVGAVAKQRGVTTAQVESDFGRGRMVMARDAVKTGMADRVATLDETISRLLSAGRRGTRSRPRHTEMETRDLPVAESRIGVSEDGRTVWGYAAVFNQWAEFDSPIYGRIRERWLPGAFKKTINERRDRIKVLFNHGKDPQIGSKPLGKLSVLREDGYGLYYEAPLDDTSYNRDLAASLRSGAIDASSMNFLAIQQSWEYRTADGIPERTVSEAMLDEVGPAVFPAFEGANAGIRSRPDAADTSDEADPTDGSAGATSEEADGTSALAAAQERSRHLELLRS